MSPLSKVANPENTSQYKPVKDPNSKKVNDLSIHNTIPITLYKLTFRDTDKEFEIRGDPLKMITNKNYKVDLAGLSDKKLMYNFAKEKNFDLKAQGNKSTRDRTVINLLKSPGLLISAFGNSNTIVLLSDPDELCDRLKLLLQQKQAGKNSNIFNDGIVVVLDKFLEYECLSKKRHNQVLIKCKLLHTEKN